MAQNIYNLSTKGEITLIDCDGQEWKIGDISDFTIKDNVEVTEVNSYMGETSFAMPVSRTLTLNITFERIDIKQPSFNLFSSPFKIKKKSVRRKIR